MSFDLSKADKLWTPRPRNVIYTPAPGQTWLYQDDTHDKGVVEWMILEVNDNDALIEKRSGQQIGYKTSYQLKTFNSRRWKPADPEATTAKILWPCPNCEQDRPILIG